MRNFIFFLSRNLRQSLVVTLRHKDRIVTETVFAVLFFCDNAVYDAFKTMNFAIQDQSHDGKKSCFAVFCAFEVFQEFVHVVFGVFAFAGITRRIHTRFAAESLNFQARIVRKTVYFVFFP